ncbi:hypothetical protein PMAYCL1PPCAC_05146, partial [Pristionchus mayeri]
ASAAVGRADRRRRRKRRRRKERRMRGRRERRRCGNFTYSTTHQADSSRARSPLSAEGPYITLSVGSEKNEESDRSKCVRRERKVVQTSREASRKSRRSAHQTDEEGKAIDSVVFDSRSQMRCYQQSSNILPTKARNSSRSPKVTTARENE